MSHTTKNVKAIIPYCKVCQDAGKSESEFRSHFTRESRDPNSKVICPTLLALECRYCFKNGHTVKYCDVLKKNKQVSNREEKRCIVTKTDTKKTQEKKKNVFMSLDIESEDEEQSIKEDIEEEFPSINSSASLLIQQQYKQTNVVNYAAALAKPAVKIEEKPLQIAIVKQEPTRKKAPWATEIKQSTKSWAAWDSDSEEDEQEEQEEEENLPVYNRSAYSYDNENMDDDWY